MSEEEKKLKERKVRKEKVKKLVSPKITMNLIERMEEIVQRLGIEVCYDQIQKPGYPGGLCRVKNRWILILNRASLPIEKAQLLAEAILTKNAENIFMSPDVREVVNWFSSEKQEQYNDKEK